MPNLQFISLHQFFLPFLIACLLQLEFEVLLEAFRNNREPTILPIIPLKAFGIESAYLMKFALLELLAFDGRVEPDIITGGSLKHHRAALVFR